MVNLTKGEGFGRPLLEFSLVNKPIITTNWSGHIDYLNPEFVTLYPINGYGDPMFLKQMIQMEKPDALMMFTDPRYWVDIGCGEPMYINNTYAFETQLGW